MPRTQRSEVDLEGKANSRVAVAAAVAARWRKMGIPFLVVHGLEAFPDGVGRDLDILMDQSLADTALVEAEKLLSESEWRSVRPPDLWGKRLVGVRSDPGGQFEYLEFHTMGSLSWFLFPLVSTYEQADREVGPFPISRWAVFVKAFVLPLLARDYERYTQGYIDQHDPSHVLASDIAWRCTAFFGDQVGGALISGLEDRDPSQLIRNASSLRRSLLEKMLRQPAASLREAPRFIKKRVKGPFTESGCHVVLTTSNAHQARSLLEAVVVRLSSIFVAVDIREKTTRTPARLRGSGTRGRQALTIDLVDEGRSDADYIIASAGRGTSSSMTIEPCDDQPAKAISSLTEWIVDAWAEGMRNQL